MKVIILMFSFLFMIEATCSSQIHPDERDIRLYKEILSLYPSDLVSGFPEKIDEKMSMDMVLRFPRGKYLNYIHLVFLLDGDEFEPLKTDLAAKAKGIYHFSDSSLITIPYDYNDFKIIDLGLASNSEMSHVLPIPNFKGWEGGFPPDFYQKGTIYLLDAQKGRFLDDDVLSKEGVGLPKEWLHGYTKGVVIFDNYATYWLEVW